MSERIPAQNLEAEMAFLGAALVDGEILDECAGIVKASDFYAHVHETIYQAIGDLYRKGQPTDKISVASRLRERGVLEDVGGLPYLSALMDTVQTAQSARHYATLIAEKSALRRFGRVAGELYDASFDESRSPGDILREFVPKIERIPNAGTGIDGVEWRELDEYLEEKLARTYPSCFPSIDHYTGGWQRGDLVIVSAANSMGKSSFLAEISEHCALSYGHVGEFQLEQGPGLTHARRVSTRSGISLRKRRENKLTDDQMETWVRTQMDLDKLLKPHLTYFQTYPRLSIQDIRTRARRLARRTNLFAIVVDHIREIDEYFNLGRRTKADVLQDAYQALRDIARELDIVVFVANHQDRKVNDSEPSIYNQKDGGSPEEIADLILMPYRPKPDGTRNEQMEACCYIGKGRNVSKGKAPLIFHGYRFLFIDPKVGRPWWEPPPPEQDDLLEYASERLGITA